MAKLTSPPRTFTLEMSEAEAFELADLLGACAGNVVGLWSDLNNALGRTAEHYKQNPFRGLRCTASGEAPPKLEHLR